MKKHIKIFLSAFKKAREVRLAEEKKEENRRALERHHRLTAMRHAWFLFFQWFSSHRQRGILAVAATFYFVSILCAPWVAKGSDRVLMALANDKVLMRYGAIFSPPDCAYTRLCHYELDVSQLLVEWVFIAIMTAIAWLWNRD
jgi:hypothetical protein